MKAKMSRIHVNQHVIRANLKNNETNPVFTIKTGKKNQYAHRVEITGPSRLVYEPHDPLSCGAKVWLECLASDVVVLI